MALFNFGKKSTGELICPFCKSRNVSSTDSAAGAKYICYNCGKYFTPK